VGPELAAELPRREPPQLLRVHLTLRLGELASPEVVFDVEAPTPAKQR
jgi:hypothetical protein